MLHRDAAAEPHGDGLGLGRVEARDDRADPVDRGFRRLDLAEVDGGLEHDEPPGVELLRGAGRDQLAHASGSGGAVRASSSTRVSAE